MKLRALAGRAVAAVGMATAITLVAAAVPAVAVDEPDAIEAVLATETVPTIPGSSSEGSTPSGMQVGDGVVEIETASETLALDLETLAEETSVILGEEWTAAEVAEAIDYVNSAPPSDVAPPEIDTSTGELTVDPGTPHAVSIGVPGRHLETEAVGSAELSSFDAGEAHYVLAYAEGTAAAFAVIESAEAPREFRFEIGAGGADADLELLENGMVAIRDGSGEVINMLEPAWALDDAGEPVATTYRVEGSTVVQEITLTGNELFPVVADPRTSCNFSTSFCRIHCTKGETQAIALGSAAGGAAISQGCSLISIIQVKAVCVAYAVTAFLGSGFAA